MIRLTLTAIISSFVLISAGQFNAARDSLTGNTRVIKVTLLGTGTSQSNTDRFGPAILVRAGSETLLFNTGRGCLQRLRQLNVSYDKISALFLGQLHSDRLVGLPDLWLTGWPSSNRTTPLKVFGPAGTRSTIEYLQKAFMADVRIKMEDDKAVSEGSKFLITEIQQGIVYEKNGVKVIAHVAERLPVLPVLEYRVEYNGHSVVLSGDTKYSENFARFAKGTDLLIHDVAIAPDTLSKANPRYTAFSRHTTPEQASKIFNEVKPKIAAYSNIVKLYGENETGILRRTKENYQGPVIIVDDLMSFVIDDIISILPWKNKL